VAALFCYKRLVVVNSRIVHCKKIVCCRINELNRKLHAAWLLDYPETTGYGGSKQIFAKSTIWVH